MNTDALLPTMETILYENHHVLGVRSTFLISCHLCVWQNITGKSFVHPLGSVSFLLKKIPICRSYLTAEDTRLQADCCQFPFFRFTSWARVLVFPKQPNGDIRIPIYQQDGAVRSISNLGEVFNQFLFGFVLKCMVNRNIAKTVMMVVV